MFIEDTLVQQNLIAASVNHYLSKGRRIVVGLGESEDQSSFVNVGLSAKKKYAEMIVAKEGNFSSSVQHFRDFYRRLGEG